MVLFEEFLGDEYALLKAYDGDEALDVAAKQKANLVLLDISLPRRNGLEVLAELRKLPDYQDVPVIAVTAHVMPDERSQFLEAGFDGYLAKPIDEDKLLEGVRKFIHA